jgi:hypothetical protein
VVVAPLDGVTISLHKLSAGYGYGYLIRQVAALDTTHRDRMDLASYYNSGSVSNTGQPTS